MLHTRSRSLRAAFAVAAAAALALTGCSSGGETPAETTAAAGDGEWPVVFQNADDTTTEIPAKPESILSTSVSVTGTHQAALAQTLFDQLERWAGALKPLRAN
ncbi:hypothetical protein F8O01_06955 [Pseudoclavibacter chungangensis]|uniref:ABC transporter substrate-binding protein n=1 Tax=Pseudoclavibacter chungangensis TaxID=587635 RepID=A0A7J5BUN4_9MICO|nr:hypothetical protein [Pseudoclavibacter chungangensis]KAB1657998.1 hypothetical protein F8O01_06955 [Pseudoclavibacter chungangensis]NYJ65840.1 ABC-type Fe2+-enterobactin transport system substrate-binding protein [Pseudoclavibacter chungangensis]